MKSLRPGIAAGAAVLALSALTLQSPAVAAPPPMHDLEDSEVSARQDNLPNPFADKRRAAKLRALAAVTSGESQAEQRGRSIGAVVDGEFVEQGVIGEDEIFVVTTEFGDEILEPFGGEPGPLHNQIEEPDRENDNSTIWQADYSREHYVEIYSETEDDAFPSLANFLEEQSNDKYTVSAQVSDWVQLEYNEARYGANAPEPPPNEPPLWTDADTYWPWVEDSVNAWWAQNCEGGSEDACNEQLAALDQQDRYDYDGDGNFQEPDGYLDHFQLIHAGVGEETGGGAQGPDAIWSHRWFVNLTDAGFTGPTVPGTSDENLNGGAQIGSSPFWVGDYTAQPENGGLGVFAHEYLHDLELPDLYATDGIENDTGFWTLMSSGSYFSAEEDGIIGDRAAGLSAWEKSFLGWVTPEDGSLYIAAAGEQEVELGPATPRSGDLAQAAVVNLPERELVVDTPDPVTGEWEWWSFYGDLLDNSLQTTDAMDLSAATEVELTASVAYSIEEGYDYIFGEVSTDAGASWTRLNGTVGGEPIWADGDVEGLDGTSGDADEDGIPDWTDLTYDLSEWAGQSEVWVRFNYVTDGGVALIGFFADDVVITANGEEILSDGAEGDDDGPWTSDGFVKSATEYIADYPQRYWIENHQLTGVDAGIDHSPYNFGFYDRPNWVEHYAYETGPMIWYNWDAFADNNVGGHPGVGINLPIDMQPEILMWPNDGTSLTRDEVRGRIQSYDAPLSLDDTDAITLHRAHRDEDGAPVGTDEATFGPLPAASLFDDVNGTYFSAVEEEGVLVFQHGVDLQPTGTQIELLAMNSIGEGVESATIRIGAPDEVVPTTPPPTPTEPTPTLPPTGGDSSSSLAGIGLAAVLAGGLLVALAARRLRQD